MQSISISELDGRFAKLLKQIPAERRAVFERLAPQMEAEVRRGVGGSGRVQGWQENRVGSGGGYAAVSPMAKTWETTRAGKRYAVGYITNSINSGHRSNGGKGKKTWVEGKHFYQDAARRMDSLVRDAAADLADKIRELVEA